MARLRGVSLRDLVYSVYERRLLTLLDGKPRPKHVGVMCDGNRRWAREMGYVDPNDGHRVGARRVRGPAGDHRRGALAAAGARPGRPDDRGAGRDPRRRAHRRAPLHPGTARSGPGHPYQWGAAPVRVPAVAVGPLGVLLLRRQLA